MYQANMSIIANMSYKANTFVFTKKLLELCLTKNNENRLQLGMFEHDLIDNITSVVYNTKLYVLQLI